MKKTVVITGSTRGIGLGMAKEFLSRGHNVVVTGTSDESVEKGLKNIGENENVIGVPCLVENTDSIEKVWNKAVEKFNTVDVWINNAGAIPAGDIWTVDEATWRNAWDLKVFGYINLCREVYAGMVDRGDGVILNIIGAAAVRPQPSYIAGAAGNSGLVGLTAALGSRSLDHNVRVLAINPGLIVTDRMGDILRQESLDKFGTEGRWEELIPTDPPPGSVEQCANVVTFFVSPRASHISGTTLTVDGGASAR